MNLNKRYTVVSVLVLVISILIASFYKCIGIDPDKILMFIYCIGSLSTVVAIYIAYALYKNYSSDVEIQRRRFDLVLKSSDFLMSKRITLSLPLATGWHFFYCQKASIENLINEMKEKKLGELQLFISDDLFEFLIDFQQTTRHFLFPKNLSFELSNGLNQMYKVDDLTTLDKAAKAEIHLIMEQKYGSLDSNKVNVIEFLLFLNSKVTTLENYLNNFLTENNQVNL